MATGINDSKANVYAALSPPKDEAVSKANAYGALAPPKAVAVSKANIYVVLTVAIGVAVSKALGYAALTLIAPSSLVVSKANVYAVLELSAPAPVDVHVYGKFVGSPVYKAFVFISSGRLKPVIWHPREIKTARAQP